LFVDEAEGVTVMVSEWLELDAADDWVRHDAAIVGVNLLALFLDPQSCPPMKSLKANYL
jgi:hypothetical protein